MHKNFTVDVRVASKSASETSSLDTASDQGIVFESNFRMTGVKFTFFLAYFSGLRFLVCHVQGEVRLWRAVCNKIFYFWNLRDFWEKLLIFGILKCSVTIEMCHSNYCNFGRLKCAIFKRSKCVIFGRPKCIIFGRSKYLVFGWLKCNFRNSAFRIAIYSAFRILF